MYSLPYWIFVGLTKDAEVNRILFIWLSITLLLVMVRQIMKKAVQVFA